MYDLAPILLIISQFITGWNSTEMTCSYAACFSSSHFLNTALSKLGSHTVWGQWTCIKLLLI